MQRCNKRQRARVCLSRNELNFAPSHLASCRSQGGKRPSDVAEIEVRLNQRVVRMRARDTPRPGENCTQGQQRPAVQNPRNAAGQRAHQLGLASEAAAESALRRDGWSILGRRVRTRSGEIDIVAEKNGILAFLEVKARQTLADAAYSLSSSQCRRLLNAADQLLADHPEWGRSGVRFDVLLVDRGGRVRRIVDAIRREESWM